jgi:hypothetical protein
MNARAILAELPNLDRRELEEVEAKVHELLGQSNDKVKHWGDALAEVAGSVREGLPEDLALNHDHYLHGTARR